MRDWFSSLNGALTLSVIALLAFLGLQFMDWRYEYPLHVHWGTLDALLPLIIVGLAGMWIWAIVVAARDSRRGLIVLLVLALVLNVAQALATYLVWCPPWTGCGGYPYAWPWTWANLIAGLLAVGATALQLWQGRVASAAPLREEPETISMG